MSTTLILASGGLNSMVAACRAKQTADVHLVHVDFGQPQASAQREAVGNLGEHLHAGLTLLNMPHVAEVAHLARKPAAGETGANAASSLESMARVPGLITVLLGAGVQVAQRIGATLIVAGSSEAADDAESAGSPSAINLAHRRDVFYLYNVLLERLQRGKNLIRVEAPLWDLTRAEIVKTGQRYGAPFDFTWTCITSGPACGECFDCIARRKAFDAAQIADPSATAVG
jgi:7-cyano-7-deazaguanine synthase